MEVAGFGGYEVGGVHEVLHRFVGSVGGDGGDGHFEPFVAGEITVEVQMF
jgi:hypothetical protein